MVKGCIMAFAVDPYKDLNFDRVTGLSLSNGERLAIKMGTYQEMQLKDKVETFLAQDVWSGEWVVGSTDRVIAMWFAPPSTEE
jgi:hypothetical protein